jgi:hypothetical protein
VRRALVIVGLAACGGDSGSALGPGDVVQSLEGVGLAVDAEAIYTVRGSGEVWRAPLDGSPPAMLAASGQLQSKDVAVDGTHAYWLTLNLQEIHRVPKLGGTPERIVMGVALRGWLGVHGQTLFYTVEGTAPGITAATVAGASPMLVGPDARDTFVVTDQSIFYAGKLGEVFRVDLPAGPVMTLAPANGEIISAIAVADNDVFYTSIQSDLQTFSTTRLRKVPINGGTPATLWEADKNALHTGMAIDATHVYWIHFKTVEQSTSDIQYELHRLRRADDEHEVYAGPWTAVREIASDEANVYIMARGGTYRIAKTR